MSLLLPSGRGSSSHNEYMISNTVLTMDWPEALYLAQSKTGNISQMKLTNQSTTNPQQKIRD